MNHGLAEVYVMKKLCKDKMNMMEHATNKKQNAVDYNKELDEEEEMKKIHGGCFSMMVKKIHPSNNQLRNV